MYESQRIAFCSCVSVLGVASAALRLFVRYRVFHGKERSKTYWLGDVFLVLAVVMTVAFAGIDIWVRWKSKHLGSMSPAEFTLIKLKVTYFIYLATEIGVYSVKASYMCFYYDLAKSLGGGLWKILVAGSLFMAVSFIAIIGWTFVWCSPYKRWWTAALHSCVMRQSKLSSTLHTSLRLMSDFIVMGVGVIIIRHSHSIRGRLWYAVAFIFFLGFLTVITNCIRYSYSLRLSKAAGADMFFTSKEGARLEEWVVLCSIAELNISLLAVSLPSFRVYWRKVMGTDFTVSVDDRTAIRGGGGFSEYRSEIGSMLVLAPDGEGNKWSGIDMDNRATWNDDRTGTRRGCV